MSNIISSALFSVPVYWSIAQLPNIQKISLGITALSFGKRLVWDYDPSISRKRKAFRWIVGGAIIAGAVASAIYGTYYLYALAQRGSLSRALVFGQNPGIAAEKDPYEIAYEWKLSQPSSLIENPVCKEKILYLSGSAESDHNRALDPSREVAQWWEDPRPSLPIALSQFSDLAYKSIRHPLQICEQIQATAKEQKIQELFIDAHGNRFAMGLSKSSIFKVFDLLPQNCFDGLAPNARIFLISCSTAANGLWQPNIAQWISWISNREVMASSQSLFSSDYTLRLIDNRVDLKFDWNNFFSTHLSQSWVEIGTFYAQVVATGLVGAYILKQMTSLLCKTRLLYTQKNDR